jgi:hypothetical protein
LPAPVVKRNKLFFSYTLRDGVVSNSLLSEIYTILVKTYDIFIDLLHNDSIDKQARVLNELKSSQYVFVLKTPMLEESSWVNIEIAETRKMGIPLFFIDLKEGCSNDEKIKKITSFVHSTIKEIK